MGGLGTYSPTIWGILNALERGGGGGGSDCSHKWADWQHKNRRRGVPNALERGGGGQNGATRGRIFQITPAVYGVPNALEQGTKSKLAHKCADGLHHLWHPGGPQRFTVGD